MLYNVVLVSAVGHRESVITTHIHMCAYISSLLSLPPTPHPALLVITECQAGLLVLYSSFPPVLCFTHGSVYMSVILSQFVPSSPSPAVPTSLFFMSATPICDKTPPESGHRESIPQHNIGHI